MPKGTASPVLKGRCLCGAVVFTVARGDLEPPDACHCQQCRRWTGHFLATVNAPISALRFDTGEKKVKWYRASAHARRGFCENCGSSLFWHAEGVAARKRRIAVALGALDAPTGLQLERHIFVANKGDYYDIADGLPQNAAE